jgi:hypothetical protein
MDLFMAGLGTLMNVFFLAMIVAGVLKLFQIHTTLGEIKDQLGKSSIQVPPVARIPTYSAQSAPNPFIPAAVDTRSGEEMLRDLDSQMRVEQPRHPGMHL